MDPGVGTLYNPIISDTDSFVLEPSAGQHLVRIKGSSLFPQFFIVGLLQDFTADGTQSSFQIAPCRIAWGCVVAMFGSLFKESALYFTTYRKGLNFSTKQYKGEYRIMIPLTF
jgi:hypothetical protein